MCLQKVAKKVKKVVSLWNYKHFGVNTVARIRDSNEISTRIIQRLVAVTRKVQGVVM